MDVKALVAEFIGTFTLIFIGAGAVAMFDFGGLVGVALAHGLVVLTFAYAYGPICGTHINPAVTLGLVIGGEFDIKGAVGYWIVQLLGGTLGALALSFALSGTPLAGNLGNTVLAPGVTPIQGLVIETILTFFLVNAIFNTAVAGKSGDMAPVAIGLTLSFCILMGGPLTGASLNPARTLGPAIVAGEFSDIWLYFVGPLLGATLAALLYTNVLKDR